MTQPKQSNPANEQELDPIINIMDMWDFAPLQDEDIRRERVYKEIQAHTNAEIAKVLDRLEAAKPNREDFDDYNGDFLMDMYGFTIDKAIQVERAKLKEVK